MKTKPLSIRTALWLAVGTLTLLIALLVGHETVLEWQRLEKLHSLKGAIVLSDQLFDATEKFSVEQDVAFSMLHASDEETITRLRVRLGESRTAADNAFAAVLHSLSSYGFLELIALKTEIESRLAGIRTMRAQIDAAMQQPRVVRSGIGERWYGETATLTGQMEELWLQFVGHFTDINPIVTQHLRFKHFLRIISDDAGRQRSIIGRLLVENADPTVKESAELLRRQGAIDLSWKISRILADQSGLMPSIVSFYTDAHSHYLTMNDMIRDIFYTPGARHGATYPIDVNLWFELSDQAAESLDELKDASFRETQSYAKLLEAQAWNAIILHMALLLGALGVCAYSFWLISRRVVGPINAMVEALVNAMEGKTVAAIAPVGREDEIGKLAQVLYAFQQNVEELTHYMQALERSNKELDDFAYIASHDLKEPLRGIHNHSCFLLEDNEGKLDEESMRKLNRLVYLSQRMERLVNDLLYFSRLGRQELAIQPTDLNEVVRDIENTLELLLGERHAKIIVPKPLPVTVCDKTRITELLRNLITNAVKYNDEPEKAVEIGCLPERMAPDGTHCHHVFYVKDNGRGIAAEFHQEVFRIFKRLQSSKDGAEEGTGVGLTFVKKIVERHGGKIWLESEPGNGTVFYFTLEGLHHDTLPAA